MKRYSEMTTEELIKHARDWNWRYDHDNRLAYSLTLRLAELAQELEELVKDPAETAETAEPARPRTIAELGRRRKLSPEAREYVKAKGWRCTPLSPEHARSRIPFPGAGMATTPSSGTSHQFDAYNLGMKVGLGSRDIFGPQQSGGPTLDPNE